MTLSRWRIWKALFFASLIISVTLVGAGAYAALFTTPGSTYLIRWMMKPYTDPDAFTAQWTEGNLARGLSFHDVEVRSLPHLPPGSILRAQELRLSRFSLPLRSLMMGVYNGRLQLPGADYPIVFSGRMQEGVLYVNLYTKQVDLQDALALFPPDRALESIRGAFVDFDVIVKGPWKTPVITGAFQAEHLAFKEFSLEHCPVSFQLQLKQLNKGPQVNGEVWLKDGTVASRNAAVRLKESRLALSGDPKNTLLDIHGISAIGGVSIRIALKGTVDRPELTLASDPPLSQEVLMLMLATGRRWGAAEGQLAQGQIPLDVARDFIDYFIFSGAGERLTQRFGISGLSLAYDPKTRGLIFKKAVANKAELRYGVEHPEGTLGQQPAATHTVGAEVKIAEGVSVEAEREVVQQPLSASTEQPPAPVNGRVLLKYKKRF